MRILVVEDDEARIVKFKRELIGNSVDYARAAGEAESLLASSQYGLVFLDHDLGQRQMVDSFDENTGYQVAVALASDEKNRGASVVVHSCNPAGADNIVAVLPGAVKAPFVALDIVAATRWAEERL